MAGSNVSGYNRKWMVLEHILAGSNLKVNDFIVERRKIMRGAENESDSRWEIWKIQEDCGTRMTQQEVADMFRMNIRDVARVTQLANCHNTRKITGENVRKGEAMKPIVIADELQFLDKYPIENFRK